LHGKFHRVILVKYYKDDQMIKLKRVRLEGHLTDNGERSTCHFGRDTSRTDRPASWGT